MIADLNLVKMEDLALLMVDVCVTPPSGLDSGVNFLLSAKDTLAMVVSVLPLMERLPVSVLVLLLETLANIPLQNILLIAEPMLASMEELVLCLATEMSMSVTVPPLLMVVLGLGLAVKSLDTVTPTLA